MKRGERYCVMPSNREVWYKMRVDSIMEGENGTAEDN